MVCENEMTNPPVCSYEGSDYQSSFWDRGDREYEDRVEAVALKRLLPKGGNLLLELGAGAGRNTPRYLGFERIVLLDYSHSQLELAQSRLGRSDRYVYVAADIYRLPFVDGLFEAATMIRTLHHMADAPGALMQVRNVLQPGAILILEFANKLNLKAILRYWFRRQAWSPFRLEPVEFARLNYDFHPRAVRAWLNTLDLKVENTLTVSHFRMAMIKRLIPVSILVWLDSIFQPTGSWFQLTPSVFMRIRKGNRSRDKAEIPGHLQAYFKCPECGRSPLMDKKDYLACSGCGRRWEIKDGIYDFRSPIK